MKAGDLVQWAPHKEGSYADHGLGFVIEIDQVVGSSPAATTIEKYKIMWHVDINDIDGYSGTWYYDEDFEDGKIVKL